MTVAPEVSDLLTDDESVLTGEARLEEIYRRYWRPLHMFIAVRVDDRHTSLAEDMAADAFVALWTKYLANGAQVWAPWALLCAIARTTILDFYKVRANKRLDFAVDFTDPANRGIERGHSYAVTQPEDASIVAELDEAMEVMADLSKKWRTAHTKTALYRSRLEGGRYPMHPATRAAAEQTVGALGSESDQLLEDFRRACTAVGALRRDLEAAGGPNWCSSTGQPPTQQRSWTKDKGTFSDPTRTHCDTGHELTLDNTLFTPQGAKRCRSCMAVTWRAGRADDAPKFRGVPEEKIQQARELLKNPDLSIRQVADMVGVGRATLNDRIPDLAQLRAGVVRRNAPISDEVLARAVKLLTDPDHPRTVRSVCAELGFSDPVLYTRVPNLPALRRKAYGGRRRISADAVPLVPVPKSKPKATV